MQFPRKIPWTKKPELPQSKIDWSNPIARGLKIALLVNEGSGLISRNIADKNNNGVMLSADGGYGVNSKGRYWAATDNTGNQRAIEVAVNPSEGSSNRTVMLGLTPVTAYPAGERLIATAGAEAVGERWTFKTSNGNLRIEIQGSGYSSSLAPIENEYNVAGCRLNGTTLGSHDLFLNGETESTSGGGTVNTAASVFTVLGAAPNSGGGERNDAQLTFCYHWDRALSDIEMLSIQQNPYQILQPRTQYIDLFTAAATSNLVFPIKRKWTTKPNQPVGIDWSNPLTKGLVAVVLSGTHRLDLATGETTSLNGASTKKANYLHAGDSTGDTLTTPINSLLRNYTTRLTVITKVKRTANGGNWSFLLDYDSKTTGVPYSPFYFQRHGSTHTFDFGVTNNRTVQSASDVTVGEWHTIAGTYVSGETNGHKFYLDGALDATATNTQAASYNDSYGLSVGEAGDGNNGVQPQDNEYVFVWDRDLSAVEVKSLTDNPYQILQPRTQLIGLTTAAAPPSGFLPIWARQRSATIGAR